MKAYECSNAYLFATNLHNRLTFSKIICIDMFGLRTHLHKKDRALSNIGLTY